MSTKKIVSSLLATTLALVPALVPALAFAESARTEAGVDAKGSIRVELVKGRAETHASTTVRATTSAKDDRIVRAKERAGQEVDRRSENLRKLMSRVEGMARISTEDRANLSTSLQSQIDALTALKAKIDSDDATTLKADIESITKSYRVYALVIPKAAVTAAADRVLTVAGQLELLSAKLAARITAAAATGADVSKLQSTLADYDAKVADAKVQATAAASAVAALSPDNGDQATLKANMAAMKDSRSKIQAAQKDVVAARKDAELIAKGLRQIHASGEASSAATTTAP